MAFVFKRPGSPCWYAGYAGPDGRQQKKSTGLRVSLGTKKAAESFAQKMEQAALRAGQGTITEARARALLSEIVERATGAAMVFHSMDAYGCKRGSKAKKRRKPVQRSLAIARP
jgi:hypothetical protein